MRKRVIVISLGGSLIVPKKMDISFLEKFKKILRKHYKKYRFVIVCGGGEIARKYISALKKEHKSKKAQSLAGIRATRTNAKFMMQFFGEDANSTLPYTMKEVKALLRKNNTVFCGGLRYKSEATSDTTTANLANFFNTSLINITNVKGLYTSDPKTSKNAKFIPKISWKNFEKMALKRKYKPGQHFILDAKAAILIKRYKILSYIMGKNLRNLDKIINSKPFIGTYIAR